MSNEVEQIISEYSDNLKKDPQVVGIVLTGSAGRKDMDQYSDIDNVVFVKGPNSVKEGKFILDKYLFDTRIVNIEDVQNSSWSEDMSFAYLNSSTIFDSDGMILKMVTEKKKEWKKNLLRRLQLSFVELSVIYEFTDNWRGLKALTHYHKFIDRGDYVSAHRILSIGLELVLDILYLINSSPIPDTKNKIKLLPITNLPEGVRELINEVIIIKSFDVEDLNRRYKILTLLIEFIKDLVEESKIEIADDLYKYYLANR